MRRAPIVRLLQRRVQLQIRKRKQYKVRYFGFLRCHRTMHFSLSGIVVDGYLVGRREGIKEKELLMANHRTRRMFRSTVTGATIVLAMEIVAQQRQGNRVVQEQNHSV